MSEYIGKHRSREAGTEEKNKENTNFPPEEDRQTESLSAIRYCCEKFKRPRPHVRELEMREEKRKS